MVVIGKNDFVELEFVGTVKGGEVFDTNIKEVADKLHESHDHSDGHTHDDVKPVIISLGLGMMLPAIDDFLVGKEVDKSYTLELVPDKAFGARKKELIRTLSINSFRDQKVRPETGMVFSFDGMMGRVSTVSGGRVIVDFNNPLAGKVLVYELTVKGRLGDSSDDLDKKIRSLINFFFKNNFDYVIEDNIVLLKVDDRFKPLVDFFNDKFKQALNMGLGVFIDKEIKDKKVEKGENNKIVKNG